MLFSLKLLAALKCWASGLADWSWLTWNFTYSSLTLCYPASREVKTLMISSRIKVRVCSVDCVAQSCGAHAAGRNLLLAVFPCFDSVAACFVVFQQFSIPANNRFPQQEHPAVPWFLCHYSCLPSNFLNESSDGLSCLFMLSHNLVTACLTVLRFTLNTLKLYSGGLQGHEL